MPELTDFERELAIAWDRDHLAVYADHLQAIGDPRGELIAIDLAGRPAESAERREELELRWLMALPSGARSRLVTDCGFITSVTLHTPSDVAALVASPFAHQLRGITLKALGLHGATRALVAELAKGSLPLLDHLAILDDGDLPSSPLIPDPSAFVAATPRLTHLTVDGRRIFGELHHPTIHTLVVCGIDAIASIAGRGPALERVTSIDYALHRSSRFDHLSPTDDLDPLPAARFPRLTHLDISRNEPGIHAPYHLGGQLDCFAWLRRSTLPALTEVVLPSLRSEGNVADLKAVIAKRPSLHIKLARAYTDSPEPPKGIASPPRRPWPPRDQVHGRDALTVKLAGHPYGEDLDLAGAVALMEYAFETFTAECRAAWTEFWEFVADLGWEDASGADIVMNLPTSVLIAALVPLDLEDERRWLDLRTLLVQRQTMGTLPEVVSIKRYWGW